MVFLNRKKFWIYYSYISKSIDYSRPFKQYLLEHCYVYFSNNFAYVEDRIQICNKSWTVQKTDILIIIFLFRQNKQK